MPETIHPQHSEASPQHTPGPWHRSEAQPDAIVGPRCTEPCRICDDLQPKFGEDVPDSTYADHFGGHFVCESVSSTANFNLITTAPRMLTTLRWLNNARQNGTGSAAIYAFLDTVVPAAIAEALGRQP